LISPGSQTAAAQTAFDDIWRFADWYSNDDNPGVQSVQFSGRFQYEYAAVNDDDITYDEWNVRRMRMGVKTQFLNQFLLHAEAEFNPQETDPFYMRLTDFYLEWSRSAPFALTVGKQSAPFTMDGATSSKELLTIDRSNLSNNMWFTSEYMPGVTVSGDVSNWSYLVGTYSSGASNREFGRFNGSVFTLASIGYDFAGALGVDQARLRGNYVYQNPDVDNTFTRQLQHMTSVNFAFEDGVWGLRADVSSGSGYQGQSDLWGAMVMPFFNITPKLQFVGRYTYLSSDDVNGVRLARYENQHTSGRGDEYNELYTGLNYFFYGHKLKLQSGLQFGDMNDRANDGGDYSGVAFTTGLRVSW
jgi:phosphate-selective porin OprO/OprP